MRIAGKVLLCCGVASLPLAPATMWSARQRGDVLTIATWNLEWLVNPATAHSARLACRSHQRAALPCDVVEDVARDSADISRIAAYANELDADIVAFQEVEDVAIASRIFKGYRICMADGSGVQHVGFAVRPGLRHHCGPVVGSLSLDGRSRNAMSMQLTPENGDAIEFLVVHLKSGCSRDPLDSGNAACGILQKQAVQLGKWISEHSAENTRYIVLGDFNRVPPQKEGDVFWDQIHTGPFLLLATQLQFSNCFGGQPYSAFIDHMLLSNMLAASLVPGSARHVRFGNADAVRYRLSDHCPVSVSLDLSRNTKSEAELSPVAR